MLLSLSRHHARVLRRMSNQIFTSAKSRSTKAAFFEDAVQTELKALTGLSYDKIFRLTHLNEMRWHQTQNWIAVLGCKSVEMRSRLPPTNSWRRRSSTTWWSRRGRRRTGRCRCLPLWMRWVAQLFERNGTWAGRNNAQRWLTIFFSDLNHQIKS